jgi:acyl dehydratase
VTTAPHATPAWPDIRVGDRLADLEIEVTPTHIVAGAIATRDFMPVHHDRAYANAQGAPDIFMNILSDTGYCSRFLTDWAGPDAMVRRIAIRLGVPLFPGSTLTYRGSVTATYPEDGEGIVEVELRATTDLGDHVTGVAVLSLPLTGGAGPPTGPTNAEGP